MEDGLTTIEEKANSEDEDHILLASFKSLDVEMNGAASDGCAKNTHVQLISTDIQTCSDKIDSAPGAVTNASSFEEQSKLSKFLVCAGACLSMSLTAVLLFMFGVLLLAFVDNFDGQLVKMTSILSLHFGLNTLLGPFCTLFIDRFSCRASLVTGGFLQCVSFLGSAFIKDINGLMPVLGVIGAGVSRLSAAHGLISFACGVGIVIGPPIASICYKSFGTYNGSFLVAGIVALAGSAFGILTSVFETPKNAEGNILCN
ncbi:uncharacterized protein LOC128211340 isoform X3 [Mya arenaria]|uniref:uncharacterized protein LOC128211340 isoform X3 n=1 Tax=Mya arenaria TaxID=6604 RepID=UPI0022E6F93C|nr:uncharacterized protein LOC128211340 isoform X3 [Mya arenaria]